MTPVEAKALVSHWRFGGRLAAEKSKVHVPPTVPRGKSNRSNESPAAGVYPPRRETAMGEAAKVSGPVV